MCSIKYFLSGCLRPRILYPHLPVTATVGAIALLATSAWAAPPLSGAIFTTVADGSVVNENVHYMAKEDVYLDGGPGIHAPPTAAGLPDGNYYFQVTDPSGKDLLSSDHISCRQITVSGGLISGVLGGTTYVYSNRDKGWNPVPCLHATGTDMDHGATTVQLYPYDDTPNPGGVYKVWVTPIGDYAGDSSSLVGKEKSYPVNGENYQPANYHGFIPAKSKTDNYKVKKNGKPFEAPLLLVRKFHDRDMNAVFDPGTEEEITGWQVTMTNPLGVADTIYTHPTSPLVTEPSGLWSLREETPSGTLQTAGYLDGVQLSLYPDAFSGIEVEVLGVSGEFHEVLYGNVGLGSITACKAFDRNANGLPDDGIMVPDWLMELGRDGYSVTQYTGPDGCVTFGGLVPGSYTLREIMPATGGWEAKGPTEQTLTITSDWVESVLTGSAESATFINTCQAGPVDFGTKGYWHNKNGLGELGAADIAYVNSLLPYSSPSTYFEAGDEPFDGLFSDGSTLVEAAFSGEEEIWIAGTPQSEISHFLTNSNAGGDPREQLAQQLLAFIFNVQHRLGSPDAAIQMPDGTWINAGDLIANAVSAWFGTDAGYYAGLLDAFNNMDAVTYIPATPCAVVYP